MRVASKSYYQLAVSRAIAFEIYRNTSGEVEPDQLHTDLYVAVDEGS